MPVFSVEGKLGTGKTKFCVWRAQLALREGRRVASNVDLRTHVLVPEKATSYVRIPDKPTSADLLAIGHGNPESYDEDRNGVLILDELGSWLNSRSFQDKDRAAVIDWLIHARKYGWDVYLIVQDVQMIDRQVREALVEYQCRCMRLDKVKVPVIGGLLSLFHKRAGYMPRMHLVAARLGNGATQVVAERWMFRGTDLHDAYDTRQIFTSSYEHGTHSVLPPWDFKRPVTLRERISTWLDSKRPVVEPVRAPSHDHDLARVVQLVRMLPVDERLRVLQMYERARAAYVAQ